MSRYYLDIGRGSWQHKRSKTFEMIMNIKTAILLGQKIAVYTPEEKVEILKKTLLLHNIDLDKVDIIVAGKKLEGRSIDLMEIDGAQDIPEEYWKEEA